MYCLTLCVFNFLLNEIQQKFFVNEVGDISPIFCRWAEYVKVRKWDRLHGMVISHYTEKHGSQRSLLTPVTQTTLNSL